MDPKKFDPSRAHVLDAPERERFLPTAALVDLLELGGDETVIDYGAGTGRLAHAAAERLSGAGRVIAVDESREMVERHLTERLRDVERAEPLLISDNHVPLDDGVAARVLAVNMLHEIRGERALDEIRRLLAPGGFVLVVDWERGRPRDSGPPDHLLYTAAEAVAELEGRGFTGETLAAELPYHFAVRGSRV